jgi:hypothetical protein
MAGAHFRHIARYDTGRAERAVPGGRLFRGTRGGMLSESVYGRAWHAARNAALSPELTATALARRPYDLRHAALSLWLNAIGEPPRSPREPGTAPASFMRSTCTASTARTTSSASGSKTPSTQAPAPRIRQAGKRAVIRAFGTTPDPVRYMSVPTGIQAAHGHGQPRTGSARMASFPASR